MVRFSELFSSRYGLALLVGCVMQMFNVMDGDFTMIMFSTTIFGVLGGKPESQALIATTFLSPCDMIGTILQALLTDRRSVYVNRDRNRPTHPDACGVFRHDSYPHWPGHRCVLWLDGVADFSLRSLDFPLGLGWDHSVSQGLAY
jgi:hypothetical protein